MRQWLYRHLPDRVRNALRPLFYRARSLWERVQLRRHWQAAHHSAHPDFFPALAGYTLATRDYVRKYARHDSTKTYEYTSIPDEPVFNPPPARTDGYNPLIHLVVPFNPPLFVAHIPNVRVFGMAGDVVTEQEILLTDISFRTPTRMWLERAEHPLLEQKSLTPLLKRKGAHALLTCLFADTNYFHWMFNALPRLGCLERAGIPFDELHFLVNRLHFAVQHEMLRALDIPQDRIIEMTASSAFQVESVWVVPALITSGHRRRWLCDWLRAHFLRAPQTINPTRRLFLSRADARWRRLANEDAVMEMLAPLGFERVVIGERSIFEQAALFSQAQVVLGPHSTAFGNLVFCQPGTRVVDFMPASRIKTYMYELSACMRLEYYYDYAEWNVPPSQTPTEVDETIIPLGRLRAMLRRIGISQRNE